MVEDRLLTTAEAALVCDVAPATIRDWHRRGLIQRRGTIPMGPTWSMRELAQAREAPKPRRNR